MSDYTTTDYDEIKDLLEYPEKLSENLDFINEDTADVKVSKDPIEKVVFQDRAKKAIRKIAQNRGHLLMVGKPGTGKSLLAQMFEKVLDDSVGDLLRPVDSIVAYTGKDNNHVRFAYANPEIIDQKIDQVNKQITSASECVEEFSLQDQTDHIIKIKKILFILALISIAGGFFIPQLFILTGLTGIGVIFMLIQENSNKVQEKIQRENQNKTNNVVKQYSDMIPEILFDPRKEKKLMINVSEPSFQNMKGGFRHDPYQSGKLRTPIHKRVFLGAHAKAPVIYIDELKTLISSGYISNLLEIMQSKKYILEGGRHSGSGAADRSENYLNAQNIIIACCNHDTLGFIQKEGDGAFLSRIEDKGEVIQMESDVPETPDTVKQVASYVKQEIINFGRDLKATWEEVIDKEGYQGVKKRCETIFGKELPSDYILKEREFSKNAVAEIVKELRCRSQDQKFCCMLRPINGIIKSAQFEAIMENSKLVRQKHVKQALIDHLSLEGAMTEDIIRHKKNLKKYICSLTDSIGYVVGLAVYTSGASARMFGQPLSIRCQINSEGPDTVIAPGKLGDIAKAAAQNVRASIKKQLQKTGLKYSGYEMHIDYIQAHGGVEGDSASMAVDIGLISDFIGTPVNLKYGITGSLTGDIILSVGGVTEKVRSIMDLDLGMEGVCIPWQNKTDIEPLLVNTESVYIIRDEIPGVRIFRSEGKKDPFDIYFCKTKYNVYNIMLGLLYGEIEAGILSRCKSDIERASA
ncbi:MAG: hypothetical protein GY729_07955 [Desulfobacteraceae bacterium]|nr:hypothetical protein [Desulfobacteraceae bacterium]